MRGKCPVSKLTSLALSVSGISSRTFVEFDSHFLVYMVLSPTRQTNDDKCQWPVSHSRHSMLSPCTWNS